MSALSGTAEIIDRHLGLDGLDAKPPRYATRLACHRLTNSTLTGFDGAALLDDLLVQIEKNCAAVNRYPSRQNWRFEKRLHIASANKSPEKTLEKAIAANGSADWANQIPTSSGLFAPTRDRHRNVDLAFRLAPGEFELIELKIESDTPVYAAMELLEYVALYIYTRRKLGETPPTLELLSATAIHWRVLAPRSYYREFHLGWLEAALTMALRESAERYLSGAVSMDFSFTSFSDTFTWQCTPKELELALKQREPLIWNGTVFGLDAAPAD